MFADLETLPNDYVSSSEKGGQLAKPAKERATFPCQSCGGSGNYRGVRVHQEKEKCFPCGGRGFFYQSEGDRMKSRAAAAKRKRSKVEVAMEIFNEENPGFVEILLEMSGWNAFAADLKAQYNAKGALSVNQVSAVLRMHSKALATRAAKAAEKALKETALKEMGGVVDLSEIHAMFSRASESGLKKPVYRAEGLILTLAKPSSPNFGAIYVKRESGEYIGKVAASEFKPTWDAKPEDKETLLKIAENPSKVAKDYGKLVGRCSCCGKELTNKLSIELGIGPICADKWGF